MGKHDGVIKHAKYEPNRKRSKHTGKVVKDPLVKNMRSERNAQMEGEAWAKESREPAKTKQERANRLNAGRRAAANLMSAAKARGKLKRGNSGMAKKRKK